ncbi:MAG: hypothetical protein IPP15_03955 [Saprospiraceae bacterium]|uniref:Uncharacterized protein n=1 Tax=Candidatus Opimibacter skivensis TaxID=2982028 RepID=A0A9D7SQV7_9BACT|nr:hypothetical protein [Candidatus Opimibacter skivensis]
MKIIKFFSLIMLLSIGFVACKDNSKSDQSADATALESAMQASKAELVKNITELQTSVNTKITEVENQLTSAAEEAKPEINVKLDILRKQKTELETLSTKVGAATAEGWADFQQKASQMVAEVKEALSK